MTTTPARYKITFLDADGLVDNIVHTVTPSIELVTRMRELPVGHSIVVVREQ
jgi:hypothetical protein